MKRLKKYRIERGRRFHWGDVDPDDHGSFGGETDALQETETCIRKLSPLQERLYAEGKRSLLIILQALDTGGKDGTIRHVMRGVNPQGCQVTSFKLPTPEERAHDFLWRIHQHVPEKGMIGIFNRSHYEDVLVTRVHHDISAGGGRQAVSRDQRLRADAGAKRHADREVLPGDLQGRAAAAASGATGRSAEAVEVQHQRPARTPLLESLPEVLERGDFRDEQQARALVRDSRQPQVVSQLRWWRRSWWRHSRR